MDALILTSNTSFKVWPDPLFPKVLILASINGVSVRASTQVDLDNLETPITPLYSESHAMLVQKILTQVTTNRSKMQPTLCCADLALTSCALGGPFWTGQDWEQVRAAAVLACWHRHEGNVAPGPHRVVGRGGCREKPGHRSGGKECGHRLWASIR